MSSIHLIAPSGYCVQQAAAARGIARLTAAGHEVFNQEVVARRFQRFAGNDSQRLADINHLAQLPDSVDIALAVRGGYGASRLLDSIDYAAIAGRVARHPLVICGHSDFTAIQCALLATTGTITWSGPMLSANFGAEQLSDFTLWHFWRAIHEPEFSFSWPAAGQPLEASGTLWGGNLAMLVSLLGTPWFPNIDGGILVIEDINEHPFRIERLLLQLHYAGVLRRQRAIILGSFSGNTLSDYDDGYNFTVMCETVSARLDIPVISGLPFGHEPDTLTLPMGARAVIHHDGNLASLTVSGHPIVAA
ncbi:muramoyltetrapeptide carboxypeptidase [Shimwellia pseudoproteus]|uniref:muramoyltetrapeptide carboxypeptidase n=1 Tax=Shimwellia pseudoproteus TaxID=570012 RepID=UPI0018EAE59D|nr:muramoyltetrapeptide carboxypeptidase [Shimwellia pseudoproteus]MBJ3813764.1 muramoyltetrapeptide carboxypeptidase [Shimwellia pseudoproteus]